MYSAIKISEFLHRKKEIVNIDPDAEYALVTVKLHHKGVVLREKKKGRLLGSCMYKISKGQFILSGIDARNGAFGIVPDELDGAIITNDFWCFDVDEKKVKRDFFYWLSNTPLFLDACVKSSKGETQRIRLQKDLFFNFEFHFPPINMQEDFLRGIHKFDSGLSVLRSEQTYQSSHLSLLRQSVLLEAIEGKLTVKWREQNPELISGNNHASELLEKIKAEKERLIKEGKIKKEKPLAPIAEAEKPFDLPEGWVWCRLGDVSINKDEYREPIAQSIRERKEKIYDYYGASGIIDKIDGYTHEGKNLLIGEDGANLVARSTPVAFIADGKYWVNNHAHVLGLLDETTLFFIKSYINAIDLTPYITGGFQPKLSQANLLIIPVPFPSLAEQRAIVERVDKPMSMIGELEKQVSKRKEQSEMLMQSVLREAFAKE